MKRYRVKKAKPNSIRVSFGRVDGELDICYSWDGVPKADAHMVNGALSRKRFGFKGYPEIQPSVLEELINRGYDIRTLNFTCEKLSECDTEGENINNKILSDMERAL